mmetsp:Transcript_3320/g.13699  ORF Transcript_3320/g.13699 Transcript_3320/m.13699 type:complete len:265 (-) Transcript_3320:668-1462(-)
MLRLGREQRGCGIRAEASAWLHGSVSSTGSAESRLVPGAAAEPVGLCHGRERHHRGIKPGRLRFSRRMRLLVAVAGWRGPSGGPVGREVGSARTGSRAPSLGARLRARLVPEPCWCRSAAVLVVATAVASIVGAKPRVRARGSVGHHHGIKLRVSLRLPLPLPPRSRLPTPAAQRRRPGLGFAPLCHFERLCRRCSFAQALCQLVVGAQSCRRRRSGSAVQRSSVSGSADVLELRSGVERCHCRRLVLGQEPEPGERGARPGGV